MPASSRFRCRLKLTFVAYFLSAFFFNHPASAQTGGSIGGRITDPHGLVIARAEVQVVNVNTGVSLSTETNESGLYSVVGIPVGVYRVVVGKTGFSKIVKPDVEVHVQDVVTLNFSLPVGSIAESVTVEGGAPLINLESAAVSTVVDRNLVSQLPLNGRSFNTLLQLTPGVVIAPSNAASPGQFSINGQRTNANYFQVDGVSANFGVGVPSSVGTYQGGGGGVPAFNIFGGTSSLVSVDGMQEFRVETSSFAPEYGRTPGGQISIVTRSGTSAFHGSAFEYFRNTVLDAANWFNNFAGLPRTPEHQNDFGAVFGGPIVPARTFFFLSYEGLRLLQPQAIVTTVPSLSARAAAIPAVAPYITAYPLPNGAVNSSNPNLALFTGVFDNAISSDAGSVRLDQMVSSQWMLFGRYSYAPSNAGSRGQTSVGLNEIDTTKLDTTTLTIGLTGDLAPHITNSIRTNYSRQKGAQVAALDTFGGAVVPSIDALLPSPLSSNTSHSNFLITGAGGYSVGPLYRTQEGQFNLIDGLTYTVRGHQLKFGVDYRLLHFETDGFPAGINYTVRGRQLASFLTSGQIGAGGFQYQLQNKASVGFTNLSVYAQDTWRVIPRLTLTYGVRWDVNPAPSSLGQTKLASWQNTDDLQALSLAPTGTPTWSTVHTNLAPRLGLAYQLTKRGDLVLRAGWGVFYDLGTGVVAELASSYPNFVNNQLAQPINVPVVNISQYKPTISLQAPYPGFSFYGFSSSLSTPRSYQWNIALEKAIGSKQAISATYVAQIGRELLRQELVDQPNSNFIPFSFFALTANGDTSDHNALQLQYRRTVAEGLQALLNYTWAHCIDTSSDDSLALAPSSLIPPSSNRGNCNYDIRHNFTGAVTYNLPQLTARWLLAQIANHWALNGVVQARTGFPIDVSYDNYSFPSQPNGLSLRPDAVPGAQVWLYGSQYPGGKALNPAAFDATTPANQGRQGNLSRNSVAGFGATQVDLSVMRAFPVVEKVNLQFRADLFNVLNHPNFANPVADLSNTSTFGVATTMLSGGLGGLTPLYQLGGPRSVQVSLKLLF